MTEKIASSEYSEYDHKASREENLRREIDSINREIASKVRQLEELQKSPRTKSKIDAVRKNIRELESMRSQNERLLDNDENYDTEIIELQKRREYDGRLALKDEKAYFTERNVQKRAGESVIDLSGDQKLGDEHDKRDRIEVVRRDLGVASAPVQKAKPETKPQKVSEIQRKTWVDEFDLGLMPKNDLEEYVKSSDDLEELEKMLQTRLAAINGDHLSKYKSEGLNDLLKKAEQEGIAHDKLDALIAEQKEVLTILKARIQEVRSGNVGVPKMNLSSGFAEKVKAQSREHLPEDGDRKRTAGFWSRMGSKMRGLWKQDGADDDKNIAA